jgi:acid phosphatase
MSRSKRRVLALAVGWLTVLATGPATVNVQAKQDPLNDINHIVVIYEENHSFDNLYGGWEGVNGRANATSELYKQITQGGAFYSCLPQNDVNLPSCISPNAPFSIETYIPAGANTCPPPGAFFRNGMPANSLGALPGGCTEDIVHRFYQEQYQLHGGAQNLYTTGSDAEGLTQGFYDTTKLPIYLFLHSDGAPHYAIADDFFQGAFGGSFLNHQFLIAAAAPTWPGAPAAIHSVIDGNGMPTKYPLYTPTGPVSDKQLTQACPSVLANRACGDYAVNTIQPAYQPFKGSPQLPAQTGNNIGDELSRAGVTWAWYSGGWSNADGDVGAPGWTNTDPTKPNTCADPNSAPNPVYPFCPNKVFQFHHQPFNYFANYAPGTPGRSHLQDEVAFTNLMGASGKDCKLNSVSFVKPIGLENEHPGYTSETEGSNHLVSLLSSIQNSACRKDTMVVVTYDEFGGQWDHVAPPGQGAVAGPHDLFGPGTRIPALIVSPHLKGDFVVDHTPYDTTSILATIEERFSLPHLSATSRDGSVNSLSRVFAAKSPFED